MNKFIKWISLNILRNDVTSAVLLEAFLEFENGIVFGKIYSISKTRFRMLVACDSTGMHRTSKKILVNIEGKYFAATVKLTGKNHFEGTFKDFPESDHKEFVRRFSVS
ncbi:hypothetical protein [Bdellovibrio bacteriovorus]|uniref:hypothetical protein n=1 Tax=Bdellovibrio bacteriovorus TaxID=959 RepID=UPI0035A67CDE